MDAAPTPPAGAPPAPQRTARHDLRRIDALLEAVYRRERVRDEHGGEQPIFPSGMRRAQGERICAIVAAERAVRTIETGFALGLSGLWAVRGALQGGAIAPRHVAIDPLQSSKFRGAGRLLFEDAGLGDALTVHERGSEVALPELLASGCEPFDFAFVDGLHTFEAALMDIHWLARLVRPGGLIGVDDLWMRGVRSAVDFFVTNVGLEPVEPFRHRRWRPFRDGLRPGFRYEAMALLRVPAPLPERPFGHFVPFRTD